MELLHGEERVEILDSNVLECHRALRRCFEYLKNAESDEFVSNWENLRPSVRTLRDLIFAVEQTHLCYWKYRHEGQLELPV
jgi:hypothetical protein